MATPIQSKDERIITCDAAIETAIASMLTADQHLDRVGALRLLVQRVTKKNVTNRVRVRTASENKGAL
jgi:hypothetical protein